MDCLEARQIVSEAFDRGVPNVPEAPAAREHCRSCADCRAFVEGLALLRKTPEPAAPPELVDAIIERGRKMAAAGVPRPYVPRAAVAPGAESEQTTEPMETPADWHLPAPVERPERSQWWWVPRAVVGTAAVAATLFVLTLSFQGFRALRPRQQATRATESAAPASPLVAAPGGAEAASGGRAADTASKMASDGPRYVVLGEHAYTLLGDRVPDPASIKPITTRVTSGLDTTAPVQSYPVWQSSTDEDIVFIRTDETTTTYRTFRRVSRTRSGRTFLLYAGPELERFGVWPVLPSRFSTPTADDGSPTFIPAGKDDSGLDVFAPPGSTADQGFAIAPGTSSADPAGADPYWTWWVPKP